MALLVTPLLVTLLLLAGCARSLPPGDAARPDLVLVSIDSLRPDHLGAYGASRPTSPFLDRLAADGLRFEEARAGAPWTLPSHLSMLTGLPSTTHQVVEDDLRLADDVPLIQEALRKAGYATGGFVTTLYLGGRYGFARGFDVYEDFGIRQRNNLSHPVPARMAVDEALKWVRSVPEGTPVFLFLHLYDVHYPYTPPPPFDTRFDKAGEPKRLAYNTYGWYKEHPLKPQRLLHLQAQYDECIAYVDSELQRLHSAWDRPSTWIVTADHGEEFGERGSWGHAHTLYPEVLDVPLILSGAGVEAGVVRADAAGAGVASHLDIAPTLAALAGVPWGAAGMNAAGVDLRGPIPARALLADTARFDTAKVSISTGGARLEIDVRGDAGQPRRELYGAGDPREKDNLAYKEPDRVTTMEAALYGALGEDWRSDPGEPARSEGLLWSGGKAATTLPDGGAFGVYPPDSTVYRGMSGVSGVASAPAEGPLRYEGSRRAVKEALDAETRRQLQALGYEQPEETEGATGAGEPSEEDR